MIIRKKLKKIDLNMALHEDWKPSPAQCVKGTLSQLRPGLLLFQQSEATERGCQSTKLFRGNFVNLTRHKDGSYRFYLKRFRVTPETDLDAYAFQLYAEMADALRMAESEKPEILWP